MSTSEKNLAFIEELNEKTNLAGSNKLELLLFGLGTCETFGINVFKIKEVTPCPKITRIPDTQRGVVGVFSLRGNVLPALDLSYFLGLPPVDKTRPCSLIVTEYSQSAQGFIVDSVDKIVRVDWSDVLAPKSVFGSGNTHSKITAITQLADSKLVSILDVEQILFEAFGETSTEVRSSSKSATVLTGFAFFADDSGIARKKISTVLDQLGISYQCAESGIDAWKKLDALAQTASANKVPLSETLRLILTDAEMPEMDGYVLTRRIKSDARFAGIPVVMHSSLSSDANRAMGASVGVDGYVAKFDPNSLAEAITSRWRP